MSSNWHKGPALLSVNVQKANGAIIEIADDVMHHDGGLVVRAAGRMTEQDRTEPGEANLTVNNETGKYTPGATGAAVRLDQGMPVVARETVGRRTFPLFDGTLAQPQASFQRLDGGVGDRVAVTAIDWVGGQQQGRRFISNLGEFILDRGGDTLVEYWPMTETQRPFLPVKNTGNPAISSRVFGSSADPVDGNARITAASGAMPLGEDSRIPVIGGPLDSGNFPAFTYHLGVTYETGATTTIPLAAGQVITIVVWVTPTLFSGVAQELLAAVLVDVPTGFTQALSLFKPVSGAVQLEATSGGLLLTGSVAGSGMETDRPYPIAARYGFSSSVFELWQGRKRYTGTLSGTPPTSATFLNCSSGLYFQGSWGHLQIYVGAAADYTFTHYLAQFDHAENAMTGGLRWQRTDERLATLSRYAGLADSQLQLDRGVAYMPRASLAGKTWLQAAAEAVETEQGRLIWRDQHLTFNNRVNTRYNV